MTSASLSEFRANQSLYIASAQREPVEILSRGAVRRAVLISPELFDRAMEALEDSLDLRDARNAEVGDLVSHEELLEELRD
ncbi:type II toxin-antitoxin system Phd/YefM family antitoxin [Corynebacterium sp. TA-R-1]|uniref:Antitoxin n=1 Tax=Corynebacterium stercoris TaxID=2943490 RepID=A0ABT1FZX9_9CORY|nr:type II toxin-antitoxin system prevent-host-death family antitoxin [Corynebacterium stercoris]MCP1387334.1 type II toxin-antitoxin system Phd/YefM family antitoxin [Corynebacterium stercoris]